MRITAIFIILGLYILLIGSYIYGFEKVDEFSIPDLPPQTTFSVVVVFRNESENLSDLITSLNQLNYPKSYYEVLFVNDESDNNSVEIIKTKDEAWHCFIVLGTIHVHNWCADVYADVYADV